MEQCLGVTTVFACSPYSKDFAQVGEWTQLFKMINIVYISLFLFCFVFVFVFFFQTEKWDCHNGFLIEKQSNFLNKLPFLDQCFAFNGSQLAKMKKSIPGMSLPWNLEGWSSWSKKLQIYLKNFDWCEYVEFGAISWKFDILSITA